MTVHIDTSKAFQPHPVIQQQPREKEMQVLCLGMSRTSTMSLYFALKKLGYNCYHMLEASLDAANGSIVYWDEAIQTKYFGHGKRYEGEDFEKMLWRYDAISDIPCILFSDELLAAYPNARVILTTRDPDSWIRSVNASFYDILSWKRWSVLQRLDTAYTSHYIRILTNTLRIWTDDDWQNRDKLKQGFAKHYAHIRSIVPEERLLEFHPQQGWEPLCKHLGKPVPQEEYPKVNQGTFTRDIHYIVFWVRVTRVLTQAAKRLLPVVAIAASVWLFRWRQ